MLRYYVEDASRPYNVVLFFTNHVDFCNNVEIEFSKLAEAYREQGGMLPEPHNNRHATFFVKIAYSAKHDSTFDRFKLINKERGILEVPNVVVTTPKMFLYQDYEFDQLI